MRRMLLCAALILAASGAFAATPYYLDRSGTLWSATASPEGLVLTGERDDEVVVTSTVPYELGLWSTSDTEIQVVADEVTGTVVVAFQRNWGENLSEIILATWRDDAWERVIHFTEDLGTHPRNPSMTVTQVASNYIDPSAPAEIGSDDTLVDSYVHLIWWEGDGESQHGTYALLRLTAPDTDRNALRIWNADDFLPLTFGCDVPLSTSVLEHPRFAEQSSHDRALMFFASQKTCAFQLFEVRFELEDPPDDDHGQDPRAQSVTTAQRRRHMPIFGVKKVYGAPEGVPMQNARVLIGASLNPVAYAVSDDAIQYVVATGSTWSTPRTLKLRAGLTIDRAIPLVENLAR